MKEQKIAAVAASINREQLRCFLLPKKKIHRRFNTNRTSSCFKAASKFNTIYIYFPFVLYFCRFVQTFLLSLFLSHSLSIYSSCVRAYVRVCICFVCVCACVRPHFVCTLFMFSMIQSRNPIDNLYINVHRYCKYYTNTCKH